MTCCSFRWRGEIAEDMLTSEGIAVFRAFTDIPYAAEIALEANAAQAFYASLRSGSEAAERIRRGAPRFEQRFKSVTELVVRRGTDEVIEIGAGLSPRGLHMTATNPRLLYVETDLAV